MSQSLATPSVMRRFATWWTIGSVVVGVATAGAILQLRDASDSVDRAAAALVTTGDTIAAFDDLPLIGGNVGDAGERIATQGERAQDLAAESRQRVVLIAALVGVLIAILGAAPMIVMSRVVTGLARQADQHERALPAAER